MGFIPKMMQAVGGLGQAMTGGAGGRAIIGAGIGGVVGGISAMDSNDPNQQINSVLGGIAAGAIGGASTRLITPAMRWNRPSTAGMGKLGKMLNSEPMTTGMPMGLKALGFGAKTAGKMGWGATKFAFRNPRMTLMAGGMGLGAYAASNFLGAESSTIEQDLDDPMASNNPLGENAAMSQMNQGLSPMGSLSTGTSIRASRMQNSTFGLVQGLNRGRH